MRITARRGLARTLFGSGRSSAWDRADKDYKIAHPICEMCGLPRGSLGGLDGAEGVQANMDAHDVHPYHLLTEEQKNDYDFLMGNLISLHHFEHHHCAHGGDPECLKYNPQIREIAAYVLASRSGLVK